MLAVLENRGDVGVHQLRGVLGLAQEAGVCRRVDLRVATQDLERHAPSKARVDGPVDLGERTLSQAIGFGVEGEVGELHARRVAIMEVGRAGRES